ncbi:MAG: hypothetical protein GX814_06225 [Microbacteriaceae bacterium]|nr:hypothetical protein [Microbacteriaceae bacterium]
MPNTSIAGNDSLQVPVTFGLTNSGILGVGVIVTYKVSLSLFDKNGTQVGTAATSPLIMPVSLNLL